MKSGATVAKQDDAPPVRRKRRHFLLGALGVSGLLVIGWGALPPRSRTGDAGSFPASTDEIGLNGWIKIEPDGTVVVAVPRVEMGQGIYTAFAMLAAEELGMPLSRVRVENVTTERIYGNVAAIVDALPIHPDDSGTPWARVLHWLLAKSARELGLIITGGSSSLADAWLPLREAAASARTVLIEAAARRWNVNPEDVAMRDGLAICGAHRLPIQQIAADAARLSPPRAVKLKPPASYRLLGRPAPRVDIAGKTDGTARFAIDMRADNLCYAAVALCPTFGGLLAGYDASRALHMPGVLVVVPFTGEFGGPDGVAVVAEHYWQARVALGNVAARWNDGPHATLDSAQIDGLLSQALSGADDGITYRRQGDGLDALRPEQGQGSHFIEAEFRVPYLAHAPMEPINCTACVAGNQVELWAPTQAATLARMAASRAAGVSTDNVKLHVPLIGGGFGRRLESDFVAQAVAIAARTNGRPVQVIWTREDDIRHDFYRPQVHARLRARGR